MIEECKALQFESQTHRQILAQAPDTQLKEILETQISQIPCSLHSVRKPQYKCLASYAGFLGRTAGSVTIQGAGELTCGIFGGVSFLRNSPKADSLTVDRVQLHTTNPMGIR